MAVLDLLDSQSSDLELRGWHVLPVGRSAANREESDLELAEGRRLVLYFSGNAANRRYRVPEFGVFTDLGLDVFIFDYRGYGDNAGSPSEEMFLLDAQASRLAHLACRTKRCKP